MDQSNANPLARYYRVATSAVALPSRGAFYTDGIVELNEDHRVSIMPMTAADESLLKNPDALLSGEAVMSVIKSCVPVVKQPRKLMSCDVDAIMVGIRAASFGDTSEVTGECPKCKAENTYTVDFESLLEAAEPLEASYEVILSNGVTVMIAPSTFDAVIKQQRAYFEGTKVQKIVANPDLSDEARLKMFSDSLNKLNKLNFELIVDCVTSVLATGEDGHDITVTDRKQVTEFLRNISSTDVDRIESKIAEINSHGVKKDLDAVCRECGHEWKVGVEFNDSNFSSGS